MGKATGIHLRARHYWRGAREGRRSKATASDARHLIPLSMTFHCEPPIGCLGAIRHGTWAVIGELKAEGQVTALLVGLPVPDNLALARLPLPFSLERIIVSVGLGVIGALRLEPAIAIERQH